MNYDCLKNYGVFVRNTAQHISRYDDIYKAASELPYDMRAYHMQSSFACIAQDQFRTLHLLVPRSALQSNTARKQFPK